MKINSRWILVTVVVSLALLLSMTSSRPVQAGADHVRWDIIHFNPATTPPTDNPGGFAIASARNPNTLSIKLTGSGTFEGPESDELSSDDVKGGGTWETFSGATLTGSGSYEVTELVSWTLSTLQTGTFIDNIDEGRRANGVAVLRIRYSDGSDGILGVGCHGPGAPDGTLEGVIASKGSVTYWDAQAPVGGVDANRTLFHIMSRREE